MKERFPPYAFTTKLGVESWGIGVVEHIINYHLGFADVAYNVRMLTGYKWGDGVGRSNSFTRDNGHGLNLGLLFFNMTI
jgi:hypothetical protein